MLLINTKALLFANLVFLWLFILENNFLDMFALLEGFIHFKVNFNLNITLF